VEEREMKQLFSTLILLAAGWWTWNGPIHDWRHAPQSDAELLQANEQNMARCLRAEEYITGATGQSNGDPEVRCARKYNLYRHEGRWYSYDVPRHAG
jgi:hypothetical protein